MNDWAPIMGLPLWAWLFVLPTLLVFAFGFWGQAAKPWLAPVWRMLDKIYLTSGIIAACFMVIILLIIIAQMIARWTGMTFHGSTEFAGYAMAATSFFAFAYALNHGAHIRVSVFLNLNDFTKKWLDAFAMLVAALIATFFARYAIKTNFLSDLLNDRTQGQDQVPEWLLSLFSMLNASPSEWSALWEKAGDAWVYTPVWLPQLSMSIGTVLLAIALWDNLIRLLVNGQSNIQTETVLR